MKRFERLFPEPAPALVSALQERLRVSEITARALAARGISDAAEAEGFLRPERASLFDPMLLPDMALAAERIRRAVASHERICIYGDYDADGVCATAILFKQLVRMGADVGCFVPSRHTDGYGMHDSTVSDICESGADLIVTVDNGITALEEIALCTEYGVDVIVTDHHIAGESLPECVAVVAASREDSTYPYPWLCGAGVALKLATVLADGEIAEELLGLAALATMADVVPLTGENRAIVQLGLPFVRQNRGLYALLQRAGADAQQIDAATLAFVLAPRLNAAGRMGDASRAILLLTEADPARVDALAAELQQDNTRRREDEAAVLCDIYGMIPEEELKKRRGIVLCGHGWNIGVLGIVASRLCEKYSCPVLLFTEHQDMLTGSGRSTDRIHLYDSLLPFAGEFSRFGGHARAVGVTMEPEAFERFAERYVEYLDAHYDAACFAPVYRYEQAISLKEVTPELVRELANLAPFGEGNPEPAFLIHDAALRQPRAIGKDGVHLAATAEQDGASLRAVGFRMGQAASDGAALSKTDLLCTLQINTFRGETRAELRLLVIDPAEAGSEPATSKINRANVSEVLYNAHGDYDNLCALFSEAAANGQIRVRDAEKAQMRTVYRSFLERLSHGGVPADALLAPLSMAEQWALCVFVELGFFALDPASRRVQTAPGCQPRELTGSTVYRAVCGVNTNFGGAT